MYTCEIVNLDEFRREWHRAEEEIGAGTVRGVTLACREGAAEALRTRRWKDRTGETAKRTRGVVEFSTHGGATGFIECAVPHASYLSEGTEPHDIYPKATRGSSVASRKPGQTVRKLSDIGTTRVSLRWYNSGGGAVFARSVRHPGTAPDPFFANAYLKAERVMLREVELGAERAQRILDS